MNGNGRNPAHGDNSGSFGTTDRVAALPANQQKALGALLSTPNVEAAAAQCGLTSRTIKRYLATQEFAEAYREQRMLMLNETIASLEKAGIDAVAAMTGALKDEDVNVRLRAARAVLDYLLKGAELERRNRELDEVETEIQELRELIAAANESNNY